MKNILAVSGGSILWLMILSGCGGDGSSGSCGNTAPCGGNIVGAWTISASCVTVNASMFDADCPTATAGSSSLKITGSVAYNADMTYLSNTTVSGSVTVNLPASCITINGITVTCDQLTQALATNPNFLTAKCTGTSGCSCTVTQVPESSTQMGTYTTNAVGLLTETGAGGVSSSSDYCVKGNTLAISPRAGSAMMGQGTVSGSVKLTKN